MYHISVLPVLTHYCPGCEEGRERERGIEREREREREGEGKREREREREREMEREKGEREGESVSHISTSGLNPLLPRVQRIKIHNLILNRLLIVEFVKKMVYLVSVRD